MGDFQDSEGIGTGPHLNTWLLCVCIQNTSPLLSQITALGLLYFLNIERGHTVHLLYEPLWKLATLSHQRVVDIITPDSYLISNNISECVCSTC